MIICVAAQAAVWILHQKRNQQKEERKIKWKKQIWFVSTVEMIKNSILGRDTAVHARERYSGTCNVFFRTDEKEADNTCMYDAAQHKLLSKYINCAECDRKICLVEDVVDLKEWL